VPADVPLDRPGGPLSAEVHFWRRYLVGWHVLAGATGALVGVLVATDAQLPPARRWLAVCVLLALATWYVAVGARALHREDERAGLVYLIGVTVGFGVLVVLTTTSGFLLFALNPQVFFMVHGWRPRITVLVVLAAELSAGLLYHAGLTAVAVIEVAVLVVFPLFLAVLLGAFITGIVVQSRQRATLIEELTETRAALARERHDAGVRAERERLASEIHDTLAQGFASIVLLTQAARAALNRDPAAADRRLELVERTARDNLDEARALVAALAPPDLADSSLADALARLAARYGRDTGVPVRVTVAGEPGGGTPETDVVLLRAVQEALTNVHKHAAASSVHIELSRVDGRAEVAVSDDGRGFDPDAATEGYGLSGLRARAVAFGGTCSVCSTPGGLTTVRVELPA